MAQLSGEALLAEIAKLRAERDAAVAEAAAAKAAKVSGAVSQTHVAGTAKNGSPYDGLSIRQGSMNLYASHNCALWLADLMERGIVSPATIRAAIALPPKPKK